MIHWWLTIKSSFDKSVVNWGLTFQRNSGLVFQCYFGLLCRAMTFHRNTFVTLFMKSFRELKDSLLIHKKNCIFQWNPNETRSFRKFFEAHTQWNSGPNVITQLKHRCLLSKWYKGRITNTGSRSLSLLQVTEKSMPWSRWHILGKIINEKAHRTTEQSECGRLRH